MKGATLETELEQAAAARKAVNQAILRTRASQLAAEVTENETVEETFELAMFELAGERYAIFSDYIREIFPVREITPLPCTPAFVLGIVNVRGQILSVIDLHPLFGLTATFQNPRNRVIIIGHPENEDGEMVLGIMADVILGVQTLTRIEIQALPAAAGGARPEYVEGVTIDGLIVLDAHCILTDDRIIVHEEVN